MDGTSETGRSQPETAQAQFSAMLDLAARADDRPFLSGADKLLGFRPTRHTPLGADATLYVPALDPDPADREDDED